MLTYLKNWLFASSIAEDATNDLSIKSLDGFDTPDNSLSPYERMREAASKLPVPLTVMNDNIRQYQPDLRDIDAHTKPYTGMEGFERMTILYTEQTVDPKKEELAQQFK